MSTKFLNQVKLNSSFTTSNTPVIADDDGQTALQKLQGQINVLAPASGAETVFNGIENAALFSVSYSASTQVFSVTYSAGAAYTVSGTRYAPTAGTVTTTPHATTAGIYYLYYDSTGTLEVSDTEWDLLTTAQVASVYYNPDNIGAGAAGVLQYEMHAGVGGMSNATHNNLHTTRGTQLLDGCVASGYTLNTAGSANVNWTTTDGNIADEDLVLSVATQALGGANNYRILYLTGTTASPVWNWKDTAQDGIYHDGTDIYYNQNNAGTWQLTPITSDSKWVNYYILATTAYSAPQIVVAMGQIQYSSFTAASAGTFTTDISNFGLFASELVILYKVTYRRVSTDGAPGNAEITSFDKLIQNLVNVGINGTLNSNITGAAVNIAGGIANNIPYQTGANTTSFITPVNDAVLISSAAGVPSMGTTLPAVTAGSVLVTDPTTSSSASLNTALSNILAAAGGEMILNIQTFAASGTYTPTAGMKYCEIECWGGGGAGGGYAVSQSAAAGCSAGGGSGGYSSKYANAVTIGVSQTITIGVGGTGGTGAGGNGGTTSVGTLCIANGGYGATANATPGAGAPPGTGDVTISGNNGDIPNFRSALSISGSGGSTSLGSGGSQILAASNGLPGIGYGSAGSGSYYTSAYTGGNGAGGYCIITEY